MAKFDKWCPELEAALAEPFARELHKSKDKRGTFVSYHHYVARLNELVGPDHWALLQPLPYTAGAKFGLAVGVTIFGIQKWNVGDEMEDHGEPIEYTDTRTGEVKEKVVDFGSSSTNAWAQAFKRACALFGLGLYLYNKEWTARYLAGKVEPKKAQEPKPSDTQHRAAEWAAAVAMAKTAEDFTAMIPLAQNDAEKKVLRDAAKARGYLFDKDTRAFAPSAAAMVA